VNPATDSGKKRGVKLRVLVVDDSLMNRFSIESVLRADTGIDVIGHAKNGEEALQLALSLKPDVITLDIEMPKMDGFTFLRILMSRLPIPVIVVSSYGNKETVFRALELGAVDFVARNEARPDDPTLLGQVVAKVLLARDVRTLKSLSPSPYRTPPLGIARPETKPETIDALTAVPLKHVVVIGASTGGPSALVEIFSRMPTRFPGAVLVAQHMPERFTRTFAERLDRRSAMRVREARDLDLVTAQQAFVCPGGLITTMRAALPGSRAEFGLSCTAPTSPDRFAPSADALMESVAKVAGPRAIAVVMTGMGDDGMRGAQAIRAAGGRVIAESEETAIVHGMPGATIRAGLADKILTLPEIATFVASLP
jgi:two-component system chemotaxis response regulator CheB